MDKVKLGDAIEAVIEEVKDDVESCAIMTGYQPRANCDLQTTTCEYRDLCKKIFERLEQEPE